MSQVFRLFLVTFLLASQIQAVAKPEQEPARPAAEETRRAKTPENTDKLPCPPPMPKIESGPITPEEIAAINQSSNWTAGNITLGVGSVLAVLGVIALGWHKWQNKPKKVEETKEPSEERETRINNEAARLSLAREESYGRCSINFKMTKEFNDLEKQFNYKYSSRAKCELGYSQHSIKPVFHFNTQKFINGLQAYPYPGNQSAALPPPDKLVQIYRILNCGVEKDKEEVIADLARDVKTMLNLISLPKSGLILVKECKMRDTLVLECYKYFFTQKHRIFASEQDMPNILKKISILCTIWAGLITTIRSYKLADNETINFYKFLFFLKDVWRSYPDMKSNPCIDCFPFESEGDINKILRFKKPFIETWVIDPMQMSSLIDLFDNDCNWLLNKFISKEEHQRINSLVKNHSLLGQCASFILENRILYDPYEKKD